jgi:putative flippase GtrA
MLISGKLQELIFKFIKFCIAGFTCMMIDFGITYLGKEKLKTSKYIANGFGFLISATTNFFLNRAWTFQNHDPHVFTQFLKFISVALIGLGINTSVLYFFHHNRKQNFYVSKLIATGVTVFWNFIANNFITFHK